MTCVMKDGEITRLPRATLGEEKENQAVQTREWAFHSAFFFALQI